MSEIQTTITQPDGRKVPLSVLIFNQALNSEMNKGNHLKAAQGLIQAMKTWPDTRNVDTLEAVEALIREGMLRRSRQDEIIKVCRQTLAALQA